MRNIGMALRNRLLLAYRRYLTERRISIARPWLRGDLLDIGCGEARLANFVGSDDLYVGIDGKRELIQRLQREHANWPNRRFHCVNIEKENELSVLAEYSSFNTITLLAVVEHLLNPEIILIRCARMLADDGNLILTTPSQNGERARLFLRNVLPSREEVERFPHVRTYDSSDLTTLLESSALRVDVYKKFEAGLNQLCVCSRKPGG